MEKDKVPQIAFEYFIQPGNDQRKDKYPDHRPYSLLPMIQCEQNTRNYSAYEEWLAKHRFYTVKNESAEYNFFVWDNQNRSQQDQEQIVQEMMPDKIKVGQVGASEAQVSNKRP